MNNIEGSELVNSFFDSFVTCIGLLLVSSFLSMKKLWLQLFKERSMKTLKPSEHKCRIVSDDAFFLKHVSKAYTVNALEKFKKEWIKLSQGFQD